MRENNLPVKAVKYCGRKPSSSPASGGYNVHVFEQRSFLEAALQLD
jgi:2-oxoglutarate dehydrogenase complex dehydrogenase (E1) component-like enzyme